MSIDIENLDQSPLPLAKGRKLSKARKVQSDRNLDAQLKPIKESLLENSSSFNSSV